MNTSPLLRKLHSNNKMYVKYVHKYANSIYSLSYVMLEDSVAAEEVTTCTFLELYEPFSQADWNPRQFSLQAYQFCIRQCSEGLTSDPLRSTEKEALNERVLKFLWYGMKLPLADIQCILGQSVPILKAQLRKEREQANKKGHPSNHSHGLWNTPILKI